MVKLFIGYLFFSNAFFADQMCLIIFLYGYFCDGFCAWHDTVDVNCPFCSGNSVGSPYGDPDQVDASLGTLTQQRQQEVPD